MDAPLYNLKTKEAGTVTVPEAVFGVRWNSDLVHQVVNSMLANRRRGTADTKGRGDVRGGGKKPWRQKGTGRARHGSTRSPIWIGGGVTHGPNADRRYAQKINKKMKQKALAAVLSKKLDDGELLFVEQFELAAPSTKTARKNLTELSARPGFEKTAYARGKRALLVVPEKNSVIERSFSNLPTVGLVEARNVTPLALLEYQYVFVTDPEKSLPVVAARVTAPTKKITTK